MKLRFLMLAAMAAFTFTACDDDDDDNLVNADAQTRTQIITSRNWMITSVSETVHDGPAAERQMQIAAKSKDDIFMFRVSGEAIRDEGLTKEENAPQVVEIAPWSFLNEESQLKIDFVSLPTNDEIIEITPKRMVLRHAGPTATLVTTFQAVE